MKRSAMPARTKPMPRSSKPIPAKSEKTKAREPEREACRQQVYRRAGGACELAAVIPEVPCGSPWQDRPTLEVDELVGGAFRCTDQYDPDKCVLACQDHHDWKTANKAEVLRRLGIR